MTGSRANQADDSPLGRRRSATPVPLTSPLIKWTVIVLFRRSAILNGKTACPLDPQLSRLWTKGVAAGLSRHPALKQWGRLGKPAAAPFVHSIGSGSSECKGWWRKRSRIGGSSPLHHEESLSPLVYRLPAVRFLSRRHSIPPSYSASRSCICAMRPQSLNQRKRSNQPEINRPYEISASNERLEIYS